MDNSRYEAGMKIRREVVGDEAVDRSLALVDDFSGPMQELLVEYCWGAVWGRPELGRRERSILNLGMLAVLNRPAELAGHVRGALNNGVTEAEIRECLLQVAVYAGMPAGLAAFRVASDVLKDVAESGQS